MKRIVAVLLAACLVFSYAACSRMTRTQKGAAIGAASGGVVGGVIGRAAGSTAVGAILGATVGGAAGAYIGRYMDKQAQDMERDLEGARIRRVGEGINITFDSGILFDVNTATLRPATKANLADLAKILNKYNDTKVFVEGHTDATGPEDYNLMLSQRRAQAVADYLAALKVNPSRFTLTGYGEEQPVASNETPQGRQQNRRVEIAVIANEELKEVAEAQAGG